MSKVQMMRVLFNQRLAAAAEEIFGLFERTIEEYEEEVCRSHNENERQQKLLDTVFRPEVRLNRADVQPLLATTEVPPEQQERSPRLDQEDPPEPPLIKEEQEALWIHQEGEQLQGLEEADVIKLTFTPVPVKAKEVDGECFKTDADGGSEPDSSFPSDSHLQPVTHDESSNTSEAKIDDSRCVWGETREPQSGLNPLQNNEEPVGDMKCNTRKTSNSSSECAASVGQNGQLQKHADQKGEKLFSCSVCGKRYLRKRSLLRHVKLHSEEKSFSCSVCEETFARKKDVVAHMRVHTGEKPFSCSVCGSTFKHSSTLTKHFRIHTGEKPFTCSVCQTSFRRSERLGIHMRIHTGEKPYTCSVCKRSFSRKERLGRHSRIHTVERPYTCSVCGKGFKQHGDLTRHLTVHTREKEFCCLFCDKRFAHLETLRRHLIVHKGEEALSCSLCTSDTSLDTSLDCPHGGETIELQCL
uniref:zinc finger protein OZF-like n=1 Tax=Semicossyphus pulcher TaxID=241346 RepID=UPI0037E931D4